MGTGIQGRKIAAVVTLLALSLTACVASFCYWVAYTLAAQDTAWLARTGLYILARGHLPPHDIFSWTAQSKPWILYQWLFELALGAFFQALGSRALWASGLATAICLGILCFYIMPRQWLRLRLPLSLIYFSVASALPDFVFHTPAACFALINPCFHQRLRAYA